MTAKANVSVAAPPPPPVAETPPWLRFAPAIFLLLWSAGFPAGKLGLGYAAPMTFLTIRYVLVLLVLLPLLVVLRPPLPRGRAWLHLTVVGLLVQGLYFGLGYAALALGVSAGAASLIASLQPILVALLAPKLGGETVEGRAWLGLALGLAGASVVIGAGAGVGDATAAGVVVAAAAVLAMTAGSFYEKRFGTGHHPVPANIVQYGVALVAFVPFALLEGFAVRWSLPLAGSLAYLVVGNSLVAVTLLLAMVRAGKVSRVSAFFFLMPPLSAIIAWLVLGETMPPIAWLGFALAAAGVALVAGVRLPRPVRANRAKGRLAETVIPDRRSA